ncbi:hypothetical protein [Sciscionella sediminilitoris]|uniref:hypothetical protein n=1 Tax=Sciscionella sediminilitoris TaxID=1445613 RepID=UPI0004DF3426|nr:hypothetical protein [Sciscionella sp. SE31]
MGIRARLRHGKRAGSKRGETRENTAYLREWAGARRGVEGYVEPRTTVTETTVMLVAHDGEWTRRRVSGPRAAHSLGDSLGIPVYDAGVVGYPQRMRAYNRRRKEDGQGSPRPR